MTSIHYWRITKYNPINRDAQGVYHKNEWTSINDIGKEFNNVEFVFDSYIFYENLYIDAIIRIMRENEVDLLKVEALEVKCYVDYSSFSELELKNCFNNLKNNILVTKHDITQIVRLVLREFVWCKLTCQRMFVHFGYDYYMYIGSEQPSKITLKAIESRGLFVEKIASPYLNT